MPRIDPNLVPVVTDLERGLRQLGIPFGIVGALVPELLLTVRPRRMTNDAVSPLSSTTSPTSTSAHVDAGGP